MHNYLGSFILSLLTTLVVYGFVLVHQCVTSIAVNWVIFSAFVIWAVFVLATFFMFFYSLIRPDEPRRDNILYAAFDIGYSIVHAISALMFAIVIVRGQQTDFSGIPVNAYGFDLFWTFCLLSVVGYFFTVGTVIAIPKNALGAFIAIISILSGATVVVLVVGLAVSSITLQQKQKRTPKSPEIMHPIQKIDKKRFKELRNRSNIYKIKK